MIGYLSYLLSYLEPGTLSQVPSATGTLIRSKDPYFWFITIVMARFTLPDITAWVIFMIRPSMLFDTGSVLQNRPLVSVMIAGRNVAEGIIPTIRSVLGCGYPNLEIIFVDDGSTDGSAMRARSLEKTGRLRVFASTQHNGKPPSLNIGLSMARGDFLFILDADCEVQYGCIDALLKPFEDPLVGAVATNLRVRNARENILTRFQECEYAMNVSISRLWRARLGLLSILPGAGSMFRAKAMFALGGLDAGLGDDTDLTMRLRKARWKLRFAHDAVVWTDVPNQFGWLLRQRSRWARNMVKIRLHKQLDIGIPSRFGFSNMLMTLDILITRTVIPILGFSMVTYYTLSMPLSRPLLLTGLYWIVIFLLGIRLLIANDIFRTPNLRTFWLWPIYPFYRLPIRVIELVSIIRELLGIYRWHPYVPKRIWDQTTHW
ncbi:glycosyltransferase family 2 protein [Acidithiobacillus sp.]|jgi:cellulose synthase/poly-beta-1,6-N-acetylglucosamine synthase-like glycosyltransferase|uniref:glycosyltransferase family 2 protein n=1 Tax=Acidithiobacillus sp. TaxID=1872118 RepID=UPI0025B7FA53|nr:glycosyltransferase family 2 protein [Acidithiobacillus sp.]MCK9189689.1 glycosyltransferase family 2 protein [Acidithiobacillus sp.]MCK9359499.1 glycosyltransferase family 2 protein [Acidithiobacillus sp.]